MITAVLSDSKKFIGFTLEPNGSKKMIEEPCLGFF